MINNGSIIEKFLIEIRNLLQAIDVLNIRIFSYAKWKILTVI